MHVLVKNSFVHIEILVLEMLGGFPAGTFWGRSCGCSHRGAVLRQMVPFEGILVVTFFSMLVFVCCIAWCGVSSISLPVSPSAWTSRPAPHRLLLVPIPPPLPTPGV